VIPTQNCDYSWSIVEKQRAQLCQRDRATHGGLKTFIRQIPSGIANNKREKEEKRN